MAHIHCGSVMAVRGLILMAVTAFGIGIASGQTQSNRQSAEPSASAVQNSSAAPNASAPNAGAPNASAPNASAAATQQHNQQSGQSAANPSDALGAKLEPAPQGTSGPRVASVEPNSPAAQAGLQSNDRIVSVDGRHFHTPRHLLAYLSAQGGRPVPFVIDRNGRQQTIEVFPAQMQGDQAWLGVLMEEREQAGPGQQPIQPGTGQQPTQPGQNAPGGQATPGKGAAATAQGVEIAQVYPNSPAARAGLRPGDMIVQVNGQKVDDPAELISIIHESKPQSKIEFDVKRNNQEQKIPVTLGSRNEEYAAEGQMGPGGPGQFGGPFGPGQGAPGQWGPNQYPPGQFPPYGGQRMGGQYAGGQEFGDQQAIRRIEDELRQLREEVKQLRDQLAQKPSATH